MPTHTLYSTGYNLAAQLNALRAEVAKEQHKNSLLVLQSNAHIFNLDQSIANLALQNIDVLAIQPTLDRIAHAKNMKWYIENLGRSYGLINQLRDRELPLVLKMDNTDEQDFAEFFQWIADNNTDKEFAVMTASVGGSKEELFAEKTSWEDAKSQETLKTSEREKVIQGVDLRDYMIGVLKGFGYTESAINTVLNPA